MPEEFEGDLAGAVFWGADLTGARFRDVNLTDATISHTWLVDIDALVDRVVINVSTSRPTSTNVTRGIRCARCCVLPRGMRAAWAALEVEWATTITRAHALPERLLHESAGGEWSFVQTLRHLVFAMHKWFTAPTARRAFASTRDATSSNSKR